MNVQSGLLGSAKRFSDEVVFFAVSLEPSTVQNALHGSVAIGSVGLSLFRQPMKVSRHRPIQNLIESFNELLEIQRGLFDEVDDAQLT